MTAPASARGHQAGLLRRAYYNKPSEQGICWHLDHSFWTEKSCFIIQTWYKGNEDMLNIGEERNDRGELKKVKNTGMK